MKREQITTFLIWTAFLNWPPVVFWIPFLHIFAFFPCLFWLNIPALWFGLAKVIGQPHFAITAFGASPRTPFAWLSIMIFWVLLAIGLTIATTFFSRLQFRRRISNSS